MNFNVVNVCLFTCSQFHESIQVLQKMHTAKWGNMHEKTRSRKNINQKIRFKSGKKQNTNTLATIFYMVFKLNCQAKREQQLHNSQCGLWGSIPVPQSKQRFLRWGSLQGTESGHGLANAVFYSFVLKVKSRSVILPKDHFYQIDALKFILYFR